MAGRGRRRESLQAWLRRMQEEDPAGMGTADPDEFFDTLQKIQDQTEKAIGFRWHAVSTQKKQDRVLALYRQFIKGCQELGDVSDDVIDKHCFPAEDQHSGFKTLTNQICWFLGMVNEKSVPRAISDEHISYSCLRDYRTALVFWIPRKYRELKQKVPDRNQLYNRITETMRYLTHQKGYRGKQSPKKAHLGLAELAQLIDMDTRGSPCIELAECHHLAWVLGRTCALRPGSLGEPSAKDPMRAPQHLVFRDIKVTRGTRKGEFNATVLIRNLKSSEVGLAEQGRPNKSIQFYINSPQNQNNLAFSFPHRLLVLALRRGALVGHETLDDLIDGHRQNITFKEEFLDKPVLLSGTHRGLSVDEGVPLSAAALTEYLRRRGRKIGFESDISFYALRRRAGTDFARALGTDRARELMAHDPDSRALELFYMDLRPTTDVAAIALGERADERAHEMELESSTFALTKLTPRRLLELHGRALNALFRKLLATDEEYQSLDNRKDQRNRERVLRRAAFRTLLEERHKEQGLTITKEEWERRKLEVISKGTIFNQRVLELARQHSNRFGNDEDDDDEEEELFVRQHNFDEQFDEGQDGHDAQDPEADPEDDPDDNRIDGGVVHVQEEQAVSRELMDFATAMGTVEYSLAARMAMQVLLDNGLSDYRVKSDSRCPLCLDEEGTTAEQREKVWDPWKLSRHMASAFHSRQGEFVRRAEKQRREHGTVGLQCEFCVQIAPSGTEVAVYKTGAELIRHLDRSSLSLISQESEWAGSSYCTAHEELKHAIGFYEPDFKGEIEHKAKSKVGKEALKRRDRALDDAAWQFSDELELDGPAPLPNNPGVVLGSFQDLGQISKKHERYVQAAPTPGAPGSITGPLNAIPPELSDEIEFVPPPGAEGSRSAVALGQDAGEIEEVDAPGGEGNLLDGGKRVFDRLFRQ
ncbi:hypothetical protein F4780DRAFT_760567 [Xylariomycetidae sp. FL0641]|nr:hypothetical protein F4780DRAFT_760567 [Xylariomycetidae sp. FL0641]